MDPIKTVCIKAVDRIREELIDKVSKYIWSNPELGYNEKLAHDRLTDVLEGHGFRVERSWKLDTAFRGIYGEGRPRVAYICEYDALPEIGHACGHNLIATVGIGAAIATKVAMETHNLSGQVVVIGTPAEESFGGKINLLEKGAFDDIDVALMAHPFAYDVVNTTLLARAIGRASFKGRGSHAAGAPWDGLNALDAAVLGYQALACMRQQLRPNWFTHAIFSKGGNRVNIIPEEAELTLGCRAPKLKELNELRRKITKCMEGSAHSSDCEVNIKFDDESLYTELVENPTLAKLYENNARSLGVDILPQHERKLLGSSDIGNVSYEVPAIHPCFSIGTIAANHSSEFTSATGSPEAQDKTIVITKALALTGLDILVNYDIMTAIRQDFLKNKEAALHD